MRIVLWLAIALLVAGCTQPAGPDDPAGDTAPGRAQTGWEPAWHDRSVRLPGDQVAFEPNIAALPDGTLFVVAIGTPDSTPAVLATNVFLWRSQDAGATWQTVFSPDGEGQHWSYDADVVASPDGWVYIADWWIGHQAGERFDQVLVLASDDGGASWQRSVSPLPPGRIIDREYLVAGPDGWLGLFYHRHREGPNTIEAVFSQDHGDSWSEPVTVVPPEGGRFPMIAQPLRLDDGALVLPYASNHHENLDLGARTDVRIAVSTDDGTTWTQRQFGYMPRGPGHTWPLQAAASDGAITVVWARDDGAAMSLWAAATPDRGRTWDAATKVAGGGLHLMPWATGDDDGITVSWYEADASGAPHRVADGTAWHVMGAYRPAGDDAFTSFAVTDDPVHDGPLCAAPGCVEGARLGDYQAVQAVPGGALFAYAAMEAGEARVSVRSIPTHR